MHPIEGRGKFVVIDGGDGVGKSTVIKRLKQEYPEIAYTREPGGTNFSEAIRDVLLSDHGSDANVIAMMLGFFSARIDHAERLIGKALVDGKHVISDRFDAVTYSYQVYAGRPELEGLFDVLRFQVERFAAPDLYIILDAAPEVTMPRKYQMTNTDHFDRRGLEFRNKTREGFLHFAKKYAADRHAIIDASKSPELVYADVVKTLRSAKLLA